MTVRSLTLRRLLNSSVARSAFKTHQASWSVASSTFHRSLSSSPSDYVLSEREKAFYERGWLDERGLTLFKTLHENQVRSCEVFADNELYGQYNPEVQGFEYKTYREFGQQVNRARSVLQDLGTLYHVGMCVYTPKYFIYLFCTGIARAQHVEWVPVRIKLTVLISLADILVAHHTLWFHLFFQ